MSAILCVSLCIQAQATRAAAPDSNTDNNAVWYNARMGNAAAMNQLGIWYFSGRNVDRDYDQAFYWWGKAARLQNPKAIANLGVCYQYGRGTDRDSTAAVDLYVTAIQTGQRELLDQRRATAPNNAFDAMLVGLCYEKGVGVLRDPVMAAEFYGYAAENGSVEGMRRAAAMTLESGKPLEALRLYESASAQGDIKATYMMGKLRMGNMGVAADKPKAVEALRRAAEGGVPQAMTAYGSLFYTGEAIGRDISQAQRWLQKAAQAGDGEGMWLYAQALRQTYDYDQALRWYKLAAQAGYASQIEAMYSHLPDTDPFKQYVAGVEHYRNGEYEDAAQCFRAGAKDKVTDAKVMEAVAMSRIDVDKAVKTLEKLSLQSPLAAYELAQIYMGGRGAKPDTARAIKLYRQAAKAGYGKAEDALATIYVEGRYIATDRKEALRLYRAALADHALSGKGVHNMIDLNPESASLLAGYNPEY